MLNLFSFLGTATEPESALETVGECAFEQFRDIINVILPTVAGILVLCAVVLGVKIGVAYAQAEDDEAKKKAKGQLINLVLGFLIAIVCVLIVAAVGNSGIVKNIFKNQFAG